jgi:hypothetical protein
MSHVFSYLIGLLHVVFAYLVARTISQALYAESLREMFFSNMERERGKVWFLRTFYGAVALGICYFIRRFCQSLNEETVVHSLQK